MAFESVLASRVKINCGSLLPSGLMPSTIHPVALACTCCGTKPIDSWKLARGGVAPASKMSCVPGATNNHSTPSAARLSAADGMPSTSTVAGVHCSAPPGRGTAIWRVAWRSKWTARVSFSNVTARRGISAQFGKQSGGSSRRRFNSSSISGDGRSARALRPCPLATSNNINAAGCAPRRHQRGTRTAAALRNNPHSTTNNATRSIAKAKFIAGESSTRPSACP